MHCDRTDPADDHKGGYWDHVAFDPEHRPVVSVVPGARTIESAEAVVAEFHRRTEGRLMDLMTSDAYAAYETAILESYGETITPPRTGKPGRPRAPYKAPPKSLNYAVVEKRRQEGRVVAIGVRVVFGVVAAVLAALRLSRVSRAINTSFVERRHGTDRNRNARKVRKTYCFSKDWRFHEAATYFTEYSYNFCWVVRTLRVREDGHWRKQTPAMAAGLTDHVWSISEWLSFPAVQRG